MPPRGRVDELSERAWRFNTVALAADARTGLLTQLAQLEATRATMLEQIAAKTGDERAAVRAELAKFEGDKSKKPTAWVQFGKTGHFAARGGFSLTREHFESCVRDFDRWQNELVLDYDHGTCGGLFTPTNSKAAGWISQLKVELVSGGAELWGMTRFNRAAVDGIREEEWKFISPALFFDEQDRETGEPVLAALFSVALTNIPFLDGMAPLELSRSGGRSRSRFSKGPLAMSITETLMEIFGLKTEDEVKCFVDSHREELAAVAKPADEEEETEEGEEPKEPKTKEAMSKRIGVLNNLLALAKTREATQGKRLAELSAKVEIADAKDRTAAVDAAIKSGKATENERASLEKLHKTDPKLFAETIEARTQVVPLDPVTRGKGSDGKDSKGTGRTAALSQLSARERGIYDAMLAIGQSHADALTEARRAD